MADSGFSQRTHQALLNALFGKTSNFGALASAPTVFIGVSTTKPTVSGGNVTEPVSEGNGYARVETAAADWAAATDADPSVTENAEEITFATADETWAAGENFIYAVAYDAGTAGNYLGMAKLPVPKPCLIGDRLYFPAGELKFELAATPDPE